MDTFPKLDGKSHWKAPKGSLSAIVTDATLYWKGPLRGCNLYRKCTEKISELVKCYLRVEDSGKKLGSILRMANDEQVQSVRMANS